MTGQPIPRPGFNQPMPSLVGRVQEQACLREALDAASSGHGRIVLISGSAGIGKTSLVQQLLADAAKQRVLVLTGGCYDLSMTPPYGPWRETLGQATATHEPEGTAAQAHHALLDALSGVADAAAVTSQAQLFTQVHDYLTALAGGQPLVFVLEDLQWSDQNSLELLRDLSRRVTQHRILLIGTYRADELTRRDPLFASLPLLVREARATRIDLLPLTVPEVRALVTERYTLSESDTIRLVSYLQAHAEGNPFFLHEVLRTLEGERLLVAESVGWTVGELADAPVPALVLQVIEGRLVGLEQQTRSLLEIAAVVGHVVPLDVWQQVADVDEENLLGAVEEAADAHLAEPAADGAHVQFAHALIREAIYAGILPPRRRARHGQIGEALAAMDHPDPDMVAHHFQQAGDARAIDWLIRAGIRAQRSYAWHTATERFDAALALLEADSARAHERGWLFYRLARLLIFSDTHRGIAYLEEALRLASARGYQMLAAQSLYLQGYFRSLAGDVRRGLDEVQAGFAALSALTSHAVTTARQLDVADTLAIDEALLLLMRALTRSGRYREARALEGRLQDDAPAASGGLALAFAALGQPDDARRAFARERAVLYQHADVLHAGLSALHELRHVVLPFQTDDLAAREQLASEAERAYQLTRQHDQRLPARRGRLPVLVLEGHWTEAREVAEAVVGVGGHGAYLSNAMSVLAPLARDQGDAQRAWALVHRVLPAGPASDPVETGWYLDAIVHQRVAVALSLDSGDLLAAGAWLDAHDRALDWSGALLGRAEGQLLWSRYWQCAGERGAAVEHTEQALALASAPRQPLVALAAHRQLGRLHATMMNVARAETHLSAALDLATACVAPFERALTLVAQTELHIAADDTNSARITLAEARAIAETLGAQPTVGWIEQLERGMNAPHPRQSSAAKLSPRELEVVRLLATGQSNQEIATALNIRPRTVVNHVANIMNKLGMESRTAVATWAVRNGVG